MEYELNDAGPCRKTLLLKFSVEDVNKAFDESYTEINNYVQIKGFRKGKAPRHTLEKRFGSQATDAAKEHLVDTNLKDTVQKEKLQIIGQITFTNMGDNPVQNEPFVANFTLDVAPDIELPEYKGLELKNQPLEVGDEQVDAALDRYRKLFANYEPIEEPAKEGDVLKVDFVAKVDDREIMNMTDQRLRVEGEILFGLPCPDLVEKFSGAKADDKVELTVTLPDDHAEPDLRGKPALIEVSVKQVERGDLPELNDEFAAGLGMTDLATFRARIKDNLFREALMESRNKQEAEIIDKFIEDVPFELPADIIKPEADALIEQQRNRLMNQPNANPVEVATKVEAYRPEAEKLADRKMRWNIFSAKIAEKEEITVTNEDLQSQIEALAASYRTTPAKIVQRIRQFDGIGPMATEILSLKVVQFIIDHSKGGRLDPDRKDSNTESVNADAASSVAKSETEPPAEEAQASE